MTILDSFFILFESDASKLDKGLSESEQKAKGLVGRLNDVEKAAGGLGSTLMGQLAGLAGALTAALSLSAMSQAIMQASDYADSLDETAGRLQINIETLSAWGDLVKKSGGSVEGFTASIEGLNSQLAQIEVTGKSRAAPFLKELGIDLDAAANKGKTAIDFLPQIADAFSQMDSQKSIALGKRLGFDVGTIMTLQAGGREVEALIAKERELGFVTKEQGEIAAKFNDQLDDTRHAFRSVWLGVSEYVLPPLTWMAEKMASVAVFMRKHSDFIVGLMIALGAAITFYALPPLFKMAAAAVVAFAPFILAGALVAALAAAFALLYDDVMNFVNGGDSMLGQILERWPMIGQIASGIAEAIRGLLSVARWFFDTFMSLVSLAIDGWRMLFSIVGDSAPFQAAADIATGIFASMGESIGAVWDYITGKIQAALDWIGKGVALVKELGGSISGGLDGLKAGVAEAQAQLGLASGSALGAQTSTSISTTNQGGRNTQVSVGKVEVKTAATDAEGISKAIGGSIQSQMRQAAANYDDGVLA